MMKLSSLRVLHSLFAATPLVFFLLYTSACKEGGKEQKFSDAIEKSRERVRELKERFQIPGITVAVGIDDSIVWAEGFGYADVETKTPVTLETKFRAASVSKVITAGALALLYQEGRIDLDAPVQKYVPEFPEKRFVITTRQLAGHVSGVRDYRFHEREDKKHYDDVIASLEIFKDDSLEHPPGHRYSYSSYGWVLISAIIQRASGRPFPDFMRDHIFRPRGMVNTAPDDITLDIPNRATFYTGPLEPAPSFDISYKLASAGFLSTAEDLVRYGSAFLPGSDFLKPETMELLFSNQKTNDGKEIMHGIGWVVQQLENGKHLYYHPGSMIGSQAILVVQPQDRIVVAMLANRSGGFGVLTANQIACFFLGMDETECPEIEGEKKRRIEKFERYQMLSAVIHEWKSAVENHDLRSLMATYSENFRSEKWRNKTSMTGHFQQVFDSGTTTVDVENLHLRFQTRGYPVGALTYVEGIQTTGAFGRFSIRLTFIREESGPLITNLELEQVAD